MILDCCKAIFIKNSYKKEESDKKKMTKSYDDMTVRKR